MGFCGFEWVVLGFTGFYWGLRGFSVFVVVLQDCSGLKLNFPIFFWGGVLKLNLVLTGAILGFTEFYRVLRSCLETLIGITVF